MKKITGIIFGVLLVLAGVYYGLNSFGIVEYNISFDGWWTFFIIVPCLGGLFSSRDKVGNLIGLLVGIYLLLAARDVISYGAIWKLAVPTVIVLIGIKLIVKSVKEESRTHGEKDGVEVTASFNAKAEDYSGKEVKTAKVAAVFGGTKCNLTDAEFDSKSEMGLFCMFGGAEIIVPEDVEIKVNAFCLFGGISDKRKVEKSVVKTATLTINGFCMFGGADIR